MIEELLNLSAFELEYQHRSKSNPFSEKWINCTRSRARIKHARDYLYKQIKVVLTTDYREDFYEVTLRPFIRNPLQDIIRTMDSNSEDTNVNILHNAIYYKLGIEDLFILMTNVIAWEHQNYPAILENAILEESNQKTDLDMSDDLLRYYIRFLDVLSSSEIISLFDLDALRNTVKSDCAFIGKKPLSGLHLFEDWPLLNSETFSKRFPKFKENLAKRLNIALT